MTTPAMALLSSVLDSSGYMVLRGLKSQCPPIQKYFSPGDYTGVCDEAVRIDSLGYDAYFATSTFKSAQSCKATNASAVKTFKLDLDVGDEDNKYKSKSEAVAATLEFCQKNGVPVPVFVDSGYGVHAYWPMTEALAEDDGKIYAEKFKVVTSSLGLKADPTVTADVARILRVPGTRNYKRDTARAVKLKSEVVCYDTDVLCDVIDLLYKKIGAVEIAAPEMNLFSTTAIPAHLKGVVMDKTTLNLMEGKPKKFAIILRKSISTEDGCAQIMDIHDRQSRMEEPKWRAGLSIAHFCDDGEEAIHMISRAHPSYSPQDTVDKAALTVGPYTCRTFESNWPSLCDGCKHKSKITSPIQLGDYVPKADATNNVVMARNKLIDDADHAVTIPEYPFPYFRAERGGVWKAMPDDPENEAAQLVCAADFYVVDRLKDETDGYLVQLRLHTPKDGILDFTIKTKDIGNQDKFRDVLNSQGIMAFEKEVLMLRSYVKTWFDSMKITSEAMTVKTQFGWNADQTSFTIGDREVTKDGHKYSPTAASIGYVSRFYSPKGDFTEWRKTYNVYAAPELVGHAFCALVGFASPLLAFTQIKGVLLNAFYEHSGSGKTTALRAANSVWGHPDTPMMTFEDTLAARFHRMGICKNIPVCMDELTLSPSDEVAKFIFHCTSGRGKNRMNASTNSERINNTTWESITLSSANKSFTEMIQSNTKNPGTEAQLMRLVEVEIVDVKFLSKERADAIFGPLTENYGMAGEEFIRHVLRDMPRMRRMLSEEQQRLDSDVKATPKERVWSATLACIYVSGLLAREAGLVDFDMELMRNFMIDLVGKMRARISYSGKRQSRADALGEFMNLHNANTLTMKKDGNGVYVPVNEPTQQLHIRYELDDNKVFILQSEFRKFCGERSIMLHSYIEDRAKAGVLIESDAQKRLGSGTKHPSSPARVYVFKLEKE